jgi:WD40 repeat protein
MRTSARVLLAVLSVVIVPCVTLTQQPEIVPQNGHADQILSTAFNPDGRMVASGDASGAVKFWDVESGRLLRTIAAHSGRVSQLAFNADGKTLVTESKPGQSNAERFGERTVKLWDVRTGKMLLGIALAPFAFSPNGKTFAAGDGRTIKLWNASDGKLLRTLAGHKSIVGGLSFSSDGKLLTSNGGGEDSRSPEEIDAPPAMEADQQSQGDGAKLWNVEDGRLLRELPDSAELQFSPDGTLVADSVGRVRDTASGELLYTIDGMVVTFSPDTRLIAKWSSRGNADPTNRMAPDRANLEVIDARTGRVIHRFANQLRESGTEVIFSPDGQSLVIDQTTEPDDAKFFEVWDTKDWRLRYVRKNKHFEAFNRDGNSFSAVDHLTEKLLRLSLFDTTTGNEISRLVDYEYVSESPLFSPDGRSLLTYEESTLKLWSVSSGLRHTWRGNSDVGSEVSFSSDGRFFAVSRGDRARALPRFELWETRSGGLTRSFASRKRKGDTGNNDPNFAGFTPDGQQLATGDGELRDVHSGELIRRFNNSFVPGSRIHVVLGETFVELRDAASGRLLRTIPAQNPGRAVISRDGKQLALGMGLLEQDAHLKIYDVASGRLLRSFEEVSDIVTQLAFSPDSQLIATSFGSGSGGFVTTLVLDPGTGETMTNFAEDLSEEAASAGTESFLAFSPDSTLAAVEGRESDTVELRDSRTGKLVKTIKGTTPYPISATFSPDGQMLITLDGDTAMRFWSVETGELIATALSFPGGDWLALTPDGLFDGSPAAWSQMLWRFSQDTYQVAPAEIFFNEFFYPGLLAEILSGSRPKATKNIGEKDRRQPRLMLEVEGTQSSPLAAIATRTVKLKLRVEEAGPDRTYARGSGAEDVRLFRNGSLVRVWRGDVLEGRPAAELEATVPVVAGENRFIAYAFSRDQIKSADAMLEIKGADALKRKGVFRVLAVGVDSYSNREYDLRFAVADAREMAAQLRREQETLGRYTSIEVTPLYNRDATKAGLLKAFKDLASRVEPEDAVLVFFAGHGTAHANSFYLLPHDIGYAGARDSIDRAGLETILAHSVSDRELEAAFEGINAGQLLFIIDACNSGQALEAEERRRGPMNSKGLAQLAYEKGMYILTASQSFQAALEASALGHGLLTSALVDEALKRGASDREPRDGKVFAREWLDYAAVRVPAMQVAEMKRARPRGINLSFAEDERSLEVSKRSGQRPRLFYRRELERQPLVVAAPAEGRRVTSKDTVRPGSAIARGQRKRRNRPR